MAGKFNKTEYMKIYMRQKRAKEKQMSEETKKTLPDKDTITLKAAEAIIGYMDERNMRITWGDDKQRRQLTEAELGRMMSAWQIMMNELILCHKVDDDWAEIER